MSPGALCSVLRRTMIGGGIEMKILKHLSNILLVLVYSCPVRLGRSVLLLTQPLEILMES